jgi:hypothetical protein
MRPPSPKAISQKITVDKGEILQLKDTINTMVDQLSPSNRARVAREVSTGEN